MTLIALRHATVLLVLVFLANFLPPTTAATGHLERALWPEAPDWLLEGDFDADGRPDLLAAARGDKMLYLRTGTGEGGYATPRSRPLPGRITALAAGEINRRDGLPDLAIAVVGKDGPAILILQSPTGAFETNLERFPLPARATALRFMRLDDDAYRDLAITAADTTFVIAGRDRRLSWQPRQAPLPLPKVEPYEGTGLELAASPLKVAGTVYTVTSSGDESDAVPGDSFCVSTAATCTLRAAIEEANTDVAVDSITFAAGVAMPIALGSSLTVLAPVNIDGATHPAFASSPIVVVDASSLAGGAAIDLGAGSDGSTVRSLVIHSAPEAGIKITGTDGHTIVGNYIGTDLTGSSAMPNGEGVKIVGTAIDNVIGGLAPGDGNLISGNTSDGIELEIDDTLVGTVIQGNKIGTTASGLAALANGEHGVHLGSPSNSIGGTTDTARNIISWNGMHGVYVRDSDNLIQGNYIGVAVDGTAAGNLGDGIHFGAPGGGASSVGGTVAGAGNVISANAGDGIRFAIGVDTVVQGNFIGTDPTGLLDRGNGGFGVCDGCPGGFRNTIGGTVAGAGNVISANTMDGYATGTFDSVVQGNTIGLGADGETSLGNGGNGVSGSDTLIGGTTALAGNLISANSGIGVRIANDGTVLGNRIGVTASNVAAGNGAAGVRTVGVRATVGGTAVGEGNLIAHNTGDGVAVTDFGTLNTISGNSIFENGGLGIDLADDGITANDAGDSDTGTNDLQNFPSVTAANAAALSISGTLDGTGGAIHTVEVFASTTCDALGNGEGTTFLGFTSVTTGGGGGVAFSVSPTAGFSSGDVITATATNPDGSTSEFSTCFEATSSQIEIFSDGFETGDTTAW